MQDQIAARFASGYRIAAAVLLAAVMTLAASATPAMAASTLAGQWRFDEGSGQTTLDDGPLGLHGTLGMTAAANRDDPLRIGGAPDGGALRFNGRSFVHVADHRRLDLGTLTVEVVARASGSPGRYRYLVAHGSIGCFSGAYGLYTGEDGGVAFYVFDGERYYLSASARQESVWDGAWHRFTGSYDGDQVRLFVDGREVGSGLRTPTGTAIEYASMPEGTYFGSYIGSCRLPFRGDVDSVRIWNGGSSAETVATIAGTTVGPPLPPASAGVVLDTGPPKSTCVVRSSRTRIRTKRRVALTIRAIGRTGPLKRVRLSVRRANGRRVIAAPRTNAKGSARLVLRIPTSGRLRIGVVGRASCTPAFVRVSASG